MFRLFGLAKVSLDGSCHGADSQHFVRLQEVLTIFATRFLLTRQLIDHFSQRIPHCV
jgi:hypothetical protein